MIWRLRSEWRREAATHREEMRSWVSTRSTDRPRVGAKVADKLCDAGHTVIGVGIKQADIVADLSSVEGRQAAADGVLAASEGVTLTSHRNTVAHNSRPREGSTQAGHFGVRVEPNGANRLTPSRT